MDNKNKNELSIRYLWVFVKRFPPFLVKKSQRREEKEKRVTVEKKWTTILRKR